MFATTSVPPEAFYRSCEGLLHLQRTTDPNLFKTACEAALRHQRYRYAFIEQLVKTKCKGVEEAMQLEIEQECGELVPDHANIRGKAHFK
jgi:hypothetical protein